MNSRVLAFVPTYRRVAEIGRVLAQFDGPIARHIDEILVLDDRSPDATAEAAWSAAQRLIGIRVTVGRNQGHYDVGGSHKAAFAYAERHGFTHVIALDDNDQVHIGDFLPVLGTGTHRDYDAILGARFMKGTVPTGAPLVATVGHCILNRVYSAAAGRRIDDVGAGLNLYARSVFAYPATLHAPDDWRITAHLVLHMADTGRTMLFHPIGWRSDEREWDAENALQPWRALAIAAQFAFRRSRFRSTDYRKQRRSAYPFDVLWSREARPHGS